jgi:hypothetical protein
MYVYISSCVCTRAALALLNEEQDHIRPNRVGRENEDVCAATMLFLEPTHAPWACSGDTALHKLLPRCVDFCCWCCVVPLSMKELTQLHNTNKASDPAMSLDVDAAIVNLFYFSKCMCA